MDAIQLLAELCEVEPPVISNDLIANSGNETSWRFLVQIGALAELDHAETVLCSACADPHPVKVELAPEGGYRAYCPDTGWQTIDGSALLRFAVDEQWIANTIRTSIELKPTAIGRDGSPLIRIGKGKFGPYSAELFFARRITERDRSDQVTSLIAGLVGKSPAILFTTTDPDLIPRDPPARCAIVRLQDVLRVSNATVSLDESPIHSALPRAGPCSRGNWRRVWVQSGVQVDAMGRAVFRIHRHTGDGDRGDVRRLAARAPTATVGD